MGAGGPRGGLEGTAPEVPTVVAAWARGGGGAKSSRGTAVGGVGAAVCGARQVQDESGGPLCKVRKGLNPVPCT